MVTFSGSPFIQPSETMQRPSDAWKQGRWGGKIPPEKAMEIRRMLAAGYTQRKIASLMHVTQQCISRFKTGIRKT